MPAERSAAERFDVAVIGAGAAGLFFSGLAGQRGARVLLIDHFPKSAEKIRISGGGRCNFTNRDAAPEHFASENPHFCCSALARYMPRDFIAMVDRHRIGWHEKHRGQLFCDDSAEGIVSMLLAEAEAGRVDRRQPATVTEVRREAAVADDRGAFALDTSFGTIKADRVVVATGGLSIPKIGASDFGHRLARRFGHRIVEPRPALVPFCFDAERWRPFASLAGVSLAVGIEAGAGTQRARFVEDLLFTHRGLSGPAALQASSHWRDGEVLAIDLLPGFDVGAALRRAKAGAQRRLGHALAEWLPARLAQQWLAASALDASRPLAECRDRDLDALGASIARWIVTPAGTEGWRKAEVTAGGVDTRELDSRTMESRLVPGLHFIGEVVDVTGWLGGYNFQWAWASAAACAAAVADSLQASGSG